MVDRCRILLVAVLVSVAAAVGCGTSSTTSSRGGAVQPLGGGGGGDGEEGLASYYARRFTGRRTASGEPYNPQALTAAHRRLPFGTRVLVRRADGRSVVVRVNDRGPYSPERVIDLSEAAARRLDMMRAGVIRVRVKPLDD